jgi:UDP-N-acetylmuramate--alanine ligase
MHINKRHIHFIGIGGAGMNALAEIMLHYGHRVTGSDQKSSAVTERLEKLGIAVQYGHTPNLVTGAELVVYSSAVKPENPEREYALSNGIAIMRRAEMLGDLMRARFSIGVSGTHGKTTTTSLIGQVLSSAGFDPTIIVGGTMRVRGTNAVVGKGSVLVAEADEFDRSFLCMYPAIAVVTNIEADHLDCYSGIEDIRKAFKEYIMRVPFYGAVVACADDVNAAKIADNTGRTLITYGTSQDAAYRAVEIELGAGSSSFSVLKNKVLLGRTKVPLGGIHNVRNCCAAIAVCCEMGISFDVVSEGLGTFSGIRRRFETVGDARGITVIDDYAHHPSEIAATLSAARSMKFKRVVAVFQPHLYSRTRDFLEDFSKSLALADKVVVTEIYKAREEPIPGVTSARIAELIKSSGFTDVFYVKSKEDALENVCLDAKSGDGIILMGAGDICDIGLRIIERLKNA